MDASCIDRLESTGEATCRIHMKKANVLAAADDKYTHEGYGASEHHNTFEVRWSADALRTVLANMNDGDHFDPWELRTLEDE